jgi:hypothetical protein
VLSLLVLQLLLLLASLELHTVYAAVRDSIAIVAMQCDSAINIDISNILSRLIGQT